MLQKLMMMMMQLPRRRDFCFATTRGSKESTLTPKAMRLINEVGIMKGKICQTEKLKNWQS